MMTKDRVPFTLKYFRLLELAAIVAGFILGALTYLIICGATARGAEAVGAPIDIPPAMRHANYGGGSCLWAAAEDCLAWQGLDAEAAWWLAHCRGGAVIPPSDTYASAVELAEKRLLLYAYTDAGSESFLQWSSDSRRAAAVQWVGRETVVYGRGRRRSHVEVTIPGAHAVTFCGFAGDSAFFIDNNDPSILQRLPRAEFLLAWRASGGAALTFVYPITRPLQAGPAETPVAPGPAD